MQQLAAARGYNEDGGLRLAQVTSHEAADIGNAVSEGEWNTVNDPQVSLVLERRDDRNLLPAAIELLQDAPFDLFADGRPGQAIRGLGPLPSLLAEDISDLARRFAALRRVDHVRIRLEAITTNACRKIHADVTDLRLITTYAGPATQVLRQGAEPIEANLWSMQPGWVGLFKGRIFGEGHAVCLHRSPPAGDLGEKRLLLVIDTPQFPADGVPL